MSAPFPCSPPTILPSGLCSDADRNKTSRGAVQRIRADSSAQSEQRRRLGQHRVRASEAGKYEQAAEDFHKALAQDPNSPAAHYDLGIALKMTDQIEAAQKELAEAIRLDPSLPEARYTLGSQTGNWAISRGLSSRCGLLSAFGLSTLKRTTCWVSRSGRVATPMGRLQSYERRFDWTRTTPGPYNSLGQILRTKGDKQGSQEAFAAGARLKRDADAQLSNTLDQGMRGGTVPNPVPSGGPSAQAHR